MRKMNKLTAILMMIPLLFLAACNTGGTSESGDENKKPIVFADAGWDSMRLNNQIARFILENGYDKKTDVTNGSTSVTFLGLREGDIDVYMEAWTNNIAKIYKEAIEAGEVKEVSTNFTTQKQGLFVPTYVIEGDPERGIEPIAPGLKSIKDLPKYWEVFKNASGSNKGRIVGSPSAWVGVDQIMRQKMKTYNLGDTYNYFQPGGPTALSASFKGAYEEGEPWVGYYWGPTWLTAKYDVTLLEEPKFNQQQWDKNKGTQWAPVKVTIAVNEELPDTAPKVVDFLSNYSTSTKLANEILGYMQKNDKTPKEAAKWFLKEYPDVWTEWVPEDIAKKVKDAL